MFPARAAATSGLAAALLLTACSSGNSLNPASGTSSTPGVIAGKAIVYIGGFNSVFYGSVNCGVAAAAKQYGLMETYSVGADFSPATQIPLLDAAIARKPAAIIVSPSDTKALNGTLKSAAQAGIKIVTADNSITDPGFLTSAITANDYENGVRSADLLAHYAKGRSGDVIFEGYQHGGSAIVDARREGFMAEIKKYPNLHNLGEVLVQATDADGASVASAVLSAHPNLLGIVSSFQQASEPLARVIKERGLQGKLIAIASDATPGDVQAVKEGLLTAALGSRQRSIGAAAVQQAVNALTGKPVTKDVSEGSVLFTGANASDPAMQKYIYSSAC